MFRVENAEFESGENIQKIKTLYEKYNLTHGGFIDEEDLELILYCANFLLENISESDSYNLLNITKQQGKQLITILSATLKSVSDRKESITINANDWGYKYA